MNRLLRPFGLKLGPLQAGAIYFPIHFLAVGIGLTVLDCATRSRRVLACGRQPFAFLLLYPARYWGALFITGYLAELLANTLFAPQLPFSAAGLLFPVKFAAALLGVGIMQFSVRGPISFARLRHVLFFTAAALVSTLLCAIVAIALRGDLASASARTGWRCRAGGSAISWAHSSSRPWCSPSASTASRGAHARGGRAATMSAFGVLLALLFAVFLRKPGSLSSPLDVPYIVYPVLVWIAMLSGPRRTALAAGITVAIASLATTRGFGPFDSPYQLQTFLALCVLPVLLLQAVMAERDWPSRRPAPATSVSRLRRQQFRSHFPLRACRAHAGHLVARRPGRLGAQTRLRRRVQQRVHGGARRQGCAEPGRGHASR